MDIKQLAPGSNALSTAPLCLHVGSALFEMGLLLHSEHSWDEQRAGAS